MWFLEKNVLFLWRCAPILEFVIFLGGVGPNNEWLIVEFVTLNLFVGNSFGTPAILCIWWFWHWEGEVDQTSPLCGGKLSGAG